MNTVPFKNLLVLKNVRRSLISSSANRQLTFCASLIQPFVWVQVRVASSYVYPYVLYWTELYIQKSLLATVRYICTVHVCAHRQSSTPYLSRYKTSYRYICTGLQVRVSILRWTGGAWDLISPETLLIKYYIFTVHISQTKSTPRFYPYAFHSPSYYNLLQLEFAPIHVGIWFISKLQIIDTYQIPTPWPQLQVNSFLRAKAFEIKISKNNRIHKQRDIIL